MLLAIDVGNTHTVIGVYDQEKLLHHWRLETKKERTADEYGIFFKELFQFAALRLEDVRSIAISSVVPTLEFSLESMCKRYFDLKPLFIHSKLRMPLKLGLDHPEEIGADRIVNNVAGVVKYGAPLIIVDFGTATTFDFINRQKVYKGGCIVPGIAVSHEALFQRASKLPRVEIKKMHRIIGRNTIESLQAGIFFGYVGMVDEIVRRMQRETKTSCTVIATGGFTSLIAQASQTLAQVDPFLTLEGLRLMESFNRRARSSKR